MSSQGREPSSPYLATVPPPTYSPLSRLPLWPPSCLLRKLSARPVLLFLLRRLAAQMRSSAPSSPSRGGWQRGSQALRWRGSLVLCGVGDSSSPCVWSPTDWLDWSGDHASPQWFLPPPGILPRPLRPARSHSWRAPFRDDLHALYWQHLRVPLHGVQIPPIDGGSGGPVEKLQGRKRKCRPSMRASRNKNC